MKRLVVLLAIALAVPGLQACGSRVPQSATLGPTVGPAVTLPPVWTPTSLPATPLAGWKAMSGAGVSLNLPESFVGGDPVGSRAELLAIAREGGPEYEGVLVTLETATPTLVFYAWDFTVHMSTVGITRREAPEGASADEALTAWLRLVQEEYPDVVVVESGMRRLGGVDVGRAIVDIPSGDVSTRQLSYLILDNGWLYVASYASPPDRHADLLGIFEESVRTLRMAGSGRGYLPGTGDYRSATVLGSSEG
jgi:hypothetical protein